MVLTWRADVDVMYASGELDGVAVLGPIFHRPADRVDPYMTQIATVGGPGWRIACRCYRCGALLTTDTVTVDRVVPGCQGGTYVRSNIRPACGPCNSETGGALANKGTK